MTEEKIVQFSLLIKAHTKTTCNTLTFERVWPLEARKFSKNGILKMHIAYWYFDMTRANLDNFQIITSRRD